jgi:cold shock CspA family protein
MKGIVVSFHRNQHFGFICPISDDGRARDVFFHRSEVIGDSLPLEKDLVEFEVGEHQGKTVARRIRIISPVGRLLDRTAALGGSNGL